MQIHLPASQDIDLPLGFGSRHLAGASITKKTNSVAVVVSESSMVRVFDNGMVVGEIIPELWLLREYSMDRNGALAGSAAS
ncbi:MAG: diadenylate cyclase [Thermodesulfobacteriota bacterium]